MFVKILLDPGNGSQSARLYESMYESGKTCFTFNPSGVSLDQSR